MLSRPCSGSSRVPPPADEFPVADPLAVRRLFRWHASPAPSTADRSELLKTGLGERASTLSDPSPVSVRSARSRVPLALTNEASGHSTQQSLRIRLRHQTRCCP